MPGESLTFVDLVARTKTKEKEARLRGTTNISQKITVKEHH